MANSKEKINETITPEEVTPEEAVPVEKKVKIIIPMTRDDEGDVFVSVNNRTWQIQRGEEVEVPECVAEVLQHQNEALKRIIANERKLAKK